jgi:hypothetical protein
MLPNALERSLTAITVSVYALRLFLSGMRMTETDASILWVLNIRLGDSRTFIPSRARGFQLMEPEHVARYLRHMLTVPGVDSVVFVDDTLNVPVERFKQLCDIFQRHHFIGIPFSEPNT